jgi:hypothetical protein
MKKEKYIKMEGQRSFGGENLNFEKDSKWNKDQIEESWKFENNDKWHKSLK